MSFEGEKIFYSALSCSIGALASLYLLYHQNPVQKGIEEPVSQQYHRHKSFVYQSDNVFDWLDQNCSLVKELLFLVQPTCNIHSPDHLIIDLEKREFKSTESPLIGNITERDVNGGGFLTDKSFVDMNSFVIQHAEFDSSISINSSYCFLRAGPRKDIYFNPKDVSAAIVTLGDQLPGINSVIRGITMSLNYNYHVSAVFGIQYSFKGLFEYELLDLNTNFVKSIHHLGGSILGMQQTDFDVKENIFQVKQIVKRLKEKQINQLYAIADLHDHRLINKIYKEIKKQKLEIAICGISKSKDNQFPLSDNSIGFETQIEDAWKAIISTKYLCNCREFGIGIVKIVGECTGFACCEATLVSGEVNICLIPEIAFELNGPKGLLSFVYNYVIQYKYCLIVVAEGAGKAIQDHPQPIRQDIGEFLKNKFLDNQVGTGVSGLSVTYINASELMTTNQPNSLDQKLGSALSLNAVHGMMAGFTNFSVARLNNKSVFLPITELLKNKHKVQITPDNRMWQRLISKTKQPTFINDIKKYK